MAKIDLEDTIAAISTPIGEGGIGIVRLSGSEALKIADRIFLAKDNQRPSTYKSHTIHYGWIINSTQSLPTGKAGAAHSTQKKNKRSSAIDHRLSAGIIDEVMLSVMRSPRTYTKEDIVEINCHGGIVAVQMVLELVLKNGARLAGPGEFTRRAFVNGRIDLSQAEAVLDIIRAKTALSLDVALQQLEGGLSHKIKGIREALVGILAELEANIDFPDEDIQPAAAAALCRKIENILAGIEHLLKEGQRGMVFRDGIKTVICGRPNVGKSSLMNVLLRKDRVMVSPLAGTTRDIVEEVVNVRGIPLRLSDTAGIIETEAVLEKEGVQRAIQCLNSADLVLLVVAGDEALAATDMNIFNLAKAKKKIVVINKIDLPQKIDEAALKPHTNGTPVARVSSRTSAGVEQLEEMIGRLVLGGKVPAPGEELVANVRHFRLLEEAAASLCRGLAALKQKNSEELCASDIHLALEQLGQISGEVSREEILDAVFFQFCIGK